MTIVLKSGFKHLADGVQAFLTRHGVNSVVERGWKRREMQINQGPGRANRVIFMPSDKSGMGGEIVSPHRHRGQQPIFDESVTPRKHEGYLTALNDNRRPLLVSIWSYDRDRPNDQGAQVDAVDELFEWVMRAVNGTVHADAAWGRWSYTVPEERAFGLEILAELTFQHPFFDVPAEVAFPAARVVKDPAS
jgi:hypothetical protein